MFTKNILNTENLLVKETSFFLVIESTVFHQSSVKYKRDGNLMIQDQAYIGNKE